MASSRFARALSATAAAALAAAAAIGLPGTPPALASGTRAFRQASAKDFDEGELTGTAVLPTGEVAPGLLAKRGAVTAAFVWCSAAARDGSVYFGTGDDGKI